MGKRAALATLLVGLLLATTGTVVAEEPPADDAGYTIIEGDMAVPDSLLGALEGSSGGPSGGALTVPTGTRGFYTFSGIHRNAGGYAFRLITSDGFYVEALREHVDELAADLTAATGHTFTVLGGAYAPPDEPASEHPDVRGPSLTREIWVRLTDTSPCGALDEFTIGCGGPAAVDTSLGYPDAGAIWISPNLVDDPDDDPADAFATLAHEGAHALGLAHYDDSYQGSAQLMHSYVQPGILSFQTGDLNGLGYLAPGCSSGFTDVASTNQFCDAIRYAALDGIVNGYTDGTFRPGSSVSRQAMAAFLFRIDADSAAFAAPTTPTFPDVPKSHPFFTEVEWLVANGITSGYADGRFRPTAAVTRQAMAHYLRVFFSDLMVPPPDDFETWGAPGKCFFSDVGLSSPFCEDILWVVWPDNGYATGYDDFTFRPTNQVSRQAVSAFLVRAIVAFRP